MTPVAAAPKTAAAETAFVLGFGGGEEPLGEEREEEVEFEGVAAAALGADDRDSAT